METSAANAGPMSAEPANALFAGGHGRSLLALTWRQFRTNRGALAGLTVLLLLVLLAFCAPLAAPYDPTAPSTLHLRPPQSAHLMGTDVFGRDILARVIWGSRISLVIGLVSVSIAAGCGMVLGLLAGFYRGAPDAVIMMMMDIMLAFPGILLALSIIAMLGPSLRNVMIAVGISSVPVYTRVVRGGVLSARESAYIEAARVIGCRNRRVMFLHLLPNVITPVIVLSTLSVATAILTAAGLSFLGLGAQPPTPEWGAMVSDGRQYLRTAWWVSTGPGLIIMLTVLAINQVGDGLRDALDPRLRL